MQFDLEVMLLASTTKEKYVTRLQSFVKYGLLNTSSHKIAISVILDQKDDPSKLDFLPKEYKVKMIETPYWDQKVSEYLTTDKTENARWLINVNDDSSTNVGMLLYDLDRYYNWYDALYLTAERLFDLMPTYKDILIELGYGWWFNNWYENPCNQNPYDRNQQYWFAHDWEFSALSNSAVKRIRNSEECAKFILKMKDRLHCIGLADHLSGILPRLCGMHPIECLFATSQCQFNQFSYVNHSGRWHHIHYIGDGLSSGGYDWAFCKKVLETRVGRENVETWKPTTFVNSTTETKNNVAFVFPMVFSYIGRFEKCVESVKKVYGDNVDIIVANYDDRNCNKETLDYTPLMDYCAKKGYPFIRFDNEHFWSESMLQIQISTFLSHQYAQVYLVHSDIIILKDFIPEYQKKMSGKWNVICPYIGSKPYSTVKDRYSGSMWGDGRMHMSIVLYNNEFLKHIEENYSVCSFWSKFLSKSVAHSDLEHFDLRDCDGFSPNPFDHNEHVCLDLADNWSYGFLKDKSREEILQWINENPQVCYLHAMSTLNKLGDPNMRDSTSLTIVAGVPSVIDSYLRYEKLNAYYNEVLGLECQQSPLAALHFSTLLKILSPKSIIEIGTGIGGLTGMIGVYAFQKEIEFHSFDIKSNLNKTKKLLDALNVLLHYDDVLSDNGSRVVIDLIKNAKKPLFLLCDGGDKKKEINTFAKYLEVGDVIMAHDYCESPEVMNKQVWDWYELSYKDVKEELEKNGFILYMQDMFKDSAWLCARKTK